jgi:DNA-binding NarL/FixJ family response regulator
MRVLHLDHDPRAGSMFVRVVGDAVVQVTAATRADQAIALLRGRSWDVVVCDGSMPGMDGVAFMREVHRLVPSARRVVYTMHPEDASVQLARLAGVIDEVVPKTADASVLRRAIGLRADSGPLRKPMRLTPEGGVGRDIRDFAELLVADVDGKIPDTAQDKIRYYLARAWDAGFAAAGRAQR